MTRDRRLLSLDRLVRELVPELAAEGLEISSSMVKCCVQAARRVLGVAEDSMRLSELSEAVSLELRRARMLLAPAQVQRVLTAYGRLIAQLDVVQIT